MTNEELEQLLQNLTAGIERFSGTDKPLTKEEKKEKSLLEMKKETLLRIKLAREKNDRSAEFNNIMYYGTLESWMGKNPFLRHLARIRFRSTIF